MKRYLIVLAASAIALAACGSSSGGGSSSSASKTAPSSASSPSAGSATTGASGTASAANPVVYDATAKTVSFYVVAGQGGGLNFDGKQNGALSLTVPAGWKTTLDCHNAGNLPHSCAIVSGATSVQPAFPGASTPDPVTGFSPGQTESFTFTASTAGSYRLVCLVAGHEDAGMWAAFTVSSSAMEPQLQT